MGGIELTGSGGSKPLEGAELALRRLTESGLIAMVIATRERITEANGAFLQVMTNGQVLFDDVAMVCLELSGTSPRATKPRRSPAAARP